MLWGTSALNGFCNQIPQEIFDIYPKIGCITQFVGKHTSLPSVTATMVDLLGLSLVFFSALVSYFDILKLSILTTLLFWQVAVVSYEYSAEECRSLGFNRANLLCSSCNYLEEFDLSALECVLKNSHFCPCTLSDCYWNLEQTTGMNAELAVSKKAKVTRRCFTRKPSSRSAGENWVRTHKSKVAHNH